MSSSKEFERNEPNRRSIRLKTTKLEIANLGDYPPSTPTPQRTSLFASPKPTRVIMRNIRNEQQNNSTRPPVDIRDGYSLKLTDIIGSSSGGPEPVVNAADAEPLSPGEDQSLSVLQNLERQINTMEFDTRMKAERSAEKLETKKERPVHYGELPSLLNTGLSDVAGNGFGYMDKTGSDSEENLTQSSFKRGEDSRSSTGGAIGAASTYARKLKTTRTVNRTVSDTKNAENTAKLLRQKKPAPRPPMIIPTTSPPQVTKMVPKDPPPRSGSSASSMASSTGSSTVAAATTGTTVAAAPAPVPPPAASVVSSVKNSTERKISSEIMKHVVGSQKSQVMHGLTGDTSMVDSRERAFKRR